MLVVTSVLQLWLASHPDHDAHHSARGPDQPHRGMQLVRYFKAKEYNWSGLSEQQGVGGKLKRAALQFTPYTFDDFDWRAFSTPARCLESLGLVVLFLLMEARRRNPPHMLQSPYDLALHLMLLWSV